MFWFNLENDKTTDFSGATQLIDVTKLAANRDDSVTFKVEVMQSHNVDQGLSLSNWEIHYNDAKIDPITGSNIRPAGLSEPEVFDFAGTDYAKYEANFGIPALDDADSNTGHLVYGGWQHGNTSFLPVTVPNQLVTIEFQWKAGAAGNSSINIVTSPRMLPVAVMDFSAKNLVLQGPPLATLSADMTSITETAGATTITATCSLSRPAIEETTCTLAVQSGSTATPGSDYTVTPAIAGATIVIPKGQISNTRTFAVMPVPAGDGGTIDIGLGSVTADGKAVAWDMETLIITILAPGLLFTPLSRPLFEGTSATFKVHLRRQPVSDVVVDITSSDTSEVTAAPASLTFTSVNWKDDQTVTATGEEDRFDDGDKAYTLTLAVDKDKTTDDAYDSVRESISGTITDTDSTTISLSADPAVLSESAGAQDVVITASLSGGILVEADTRITLGTQSGTATAGADYAAFTPPPLTIPANMGAGSVTFRITTTADDLDDNTENIVITAALDGYEIAGLILPIHEFRLDVSALSVTTGEDESAATFDVTLPSPPARGNVVVNVDSSDTGEAAVSPPALTFTTSNWDTPQPVRITGVDDMLDDGDMSYRINLAVDAAKTADAHYHAPTQSVSGVNTDDDTAMISITAAPAFLTENAGAQDVVITARLRGGILLEVDAEIMLGVGSGTATAPADYAMFTPPSITIPAGAESASETVAITTMDDSEDDSGESIVITAAFADYVIADLILRINEFKLKPTALSGDTSEDGGIAFFTLALPTAPLSGQVVVDVLSSDTSEATASPALLIFTPRNWDTPQRVVLVGVDDLLADGAQTYKVNLAVDADKTDDDNYDGRTASVDGVNADNDTATISLRATPSFLADAGGAQSITITAELDGRVRLENDAVIALGKGGGSATVGTDYAAFTLPPSITIAKGEPSGSVTISITPMAAADDGETIIITGTLAGHAIDPLTLTIREFGLDVGAPSGPVTEAGGDAEPTVAVKLIAAPASGMVSVQVGISDTSEATASPAALTFTTSDWNMAQIVTVTGVDDVFDDGEVAYTLDFAVDDDNTDDPNYDGQSESVRLVTIDDDEVMISLSVIPKFLVEHGGGQQVAITAELIGDARLENESHIVLRDGGGTAAVDDDYKAFLPPNLTITILSNASSGSKVFSITPAADELDDSGETIRFAAALPPYAIAGITLPIRQFDLYPGALSGGAGEDGSAATFPLALPSPPESGNVVVTVRSSDTGEAAVSPPALTFTTSNWDMPQPVRITGVDDNFDDGDMPYEIALAVDDANTADDNYHGMRASVSGINADDDTAVITLRAEPAFLIEEDGAQMVTITASIGGSIRFEAATVVALVDAGGGGATASIDYIAFAPPGITIPADTASASVTFPITPMKDDADDTGENIIIGGIIGMPGDYSIAGVSIPIREYALKVRADSIRTTEAGGAGHTATFELALPTEPSGDVTVTIASTKPAAATPSPESVVFTMDNWNAPQKVVVTGVDDEFDDGDTAYALTLAAAAPGDANYDGRMARVDGVNVDDDTAMFALTTEPKFIRESGGAQEVVITAMLAADVRFKSAMTLALGKGGGSADEGADYAAFTLPAGVTIPMNAASGSATFMITPLADSMTEAEESIIISAELAGYAIDDITLTIRDFGLIASALGGDTGEDGTRTTFTLQLSAPPASGRVVVDVAASDPGEAAASPPALTFTAADWRMPQSVTVTGADDDLDDGDQPYMINLAVDNAQTDDTDFHDITHALPGVNIDDDAAKVTLTTTRPFLTKDGGAQEVVIVAGLGTTLFASEVTIMLTVGGTAVPGADYAAFTLPPGITIAQGQASGSATFSITPRASATDGSTIEISGTLAGESIAPVRITILELGLVPPVLMGQATEGGGAASFELRLAAAPSGDVVVDVRASPADEVAVSPATLIFTTTNWSARQAVRVTGKDDEFDDGDVEYTLTLAVNARTADANYRALPALTLAGVNIDDDAAMISLRASPAFLSDTGGAQRISITAEFAGAIRLESDAVIALGMGGGSAQEGADYAPFTLPPSITIPARTAAASRAFSITPMAAADDGETILITGALAGYSIAPLALPIREPGIVVGALSGDTTEAGGTATFTLALRTAPAGAVVVVIAPALADFGEVRVVSGYEIVTFSAADYGQTTPKNVLLAGVDDKILDGRRNFTINLTAAGGSHYDGLTATASGANADDETAPAKLTLRAHPAAIPEAIGAVDVVIVASFDSGVSVLSDTIVTLSAPQDGAAPGDMVADSGDDYAAVPAFDGARITIPARTTAGFATFRLTPVDDMQPDPDEKIIISGAAAGSHVNITAAANITDAEIVITEKGLAQVAAMVNRTLLPLISQRSLAGAMADIEARGGAARGSDASYLLAGHASTQSALLGYLKAAADADTTDAAAAYDWKRALADSSFVMPLNNGEGGGAFWAAGEYSELDGDSNLVKWEGNSFNLNFGADARVGGVLLGAMVSLSESEAEYADRNAGSVNRGTYMQKTVSVRPYFVWAAAATEVWGSIGGGSGSLEFTDTGSGVTNKAGSDLSETSLSLGLKHRFLEDFSVKADAALLSGEVDEKKNPEGRIVLEKQKIDSTRARLLLENRRSYPRANGVISPSMQIGLRYDASEDARASQGSAGAEAAFGIDFVNSASGLTLSGKARVYDGEEYGEWGISGSLLLQPPGGRGLSLRMRPAYGETGLRRVWEGDFGGKPARAAEYAANMRGEIAYGLPAPGGRGLLTPYAEGNAGGAAATRRLGLRWMPHARFDVDAHAENRDAADDYRIHFHWATRPRFDFRLAAERSEGAHISHAIVLKGAVRF
ncbi:MAG: hypothetical protein OD918_11465 [Gammaproteobacteria bacterium]